MYTVISDNNEGKAEVQSQVATDKLTSSEVASRLGIKRPHLIVILNRHPELRPAEKVGGVGFSAYLWSEDEIQAIEQYVNRNKQGDDQEGKGK